MVSEQVHRSDGTDQRRRIEDGKEGIAEDRDPQQDECEGDEEHAEDELPQGPAAGDAGQEEADERHPGDPPGPEEQGPVRHPLIGGVGGCPVGVGGWMGRHPAKPSLTARCSKVPRVPKTKGRLSSVRCDETQRDCRAVLSPVPTSS